MLPPEFFHQKANNSHCQIAQEIISSVLNEYGLGKYTHHTDADLDDLEEAYKGGYFGMIRNKEGDFVGTFGLYPLNAKSIEIRKMYLLPSARGNGIGKWMVNFLVDKAKELKYEKVELETASVLVEAIALYKKLGFKEVTASNATPRCDRAFEMQLQKVEI